MLPRNLCLLNTRVEGDRIALDYLTARDEPWLRALLDEYARFVGRKQAELDERLREPLSTLAPKAKLRVAQCVLLGLSRTRVDAPVSPRRARSALFARASEMHAARDEVLRDVAASLGTTPLNLERSLFADLPGERAIGALEAALSPSRLALEANLAMVGSLLRRAVRIRISCWGNTRAVVRHARLLGLICRVGVADDHGARDSYAVEEHPRSFRRAKAPEAPRPALDEKRAEAEHGVVLDISGPFALFRHTEVYGRALVSLVPRVAWCHRFTLSAACALGAGDVLSTFVLCSGDPIGAGRELSPHDSQLEARFAHDFARVASGWDVVREPRPVQAGGALIFPDFELVHRDDPQRRWLLEIVGFWTPEYLREKLERLRLAGLDRLIVCIDAKRSCGDDETPPGARVVRYRSRIDPRAVLAIVDPSSVPAATARRR